ncbi:1-phosphofructokinase [Caulobacter sp. AP07]|uniref:1-phosphofructokinase n=1 Tax=Caulobacter sp. AP07 TaxID=1144304 RepID=UPI000271FD0E|nr:1-phosphofructokinase [Caulobacter sp. AP07]EJL22489.1 1-phosphofructokinase [Caulobacter sp. AP07]
MSGPVRTVTLNPAIDQTVALDTLRPGQVHRALAVRHDPGGKGVNVASCLADWGVPTIVTGLLGADNAAPFEALFAAKAIEDRFVRVPGDTRTNIKLLETSPGGTTTDINLPSPFADAAALAEVRRRLDDVAPDDLVVLSGSLADSLPDDTYRRLIGDLRAIGARVVLDASGAPLAEALTAAEDALPFCIKPNRHELETWAGRGLEDPVALLAAARALHGMGIALVTVSLGAQGALFVSGEGALHVAPPVLEAGSAVGAGDAMVAGLTAAVRAGASLEAVARLSTAFATGKLRHPGAHLPDGETVLALAALAAITPAQDWARRTTGPRQTAH